MPTHGAHRAHEAPWPTPLSFESPLPNGSLPSCVGPEAHGAPGPPTPSDSPLTTDSLPSLTAGSPPSPTGSLPSPNYLSLTGQLIPSAAERTRLHPPSFPSEPRASLGPTFPCPPTLLPAPHPQGYYLPSPGKYLPSYYDVIICNPPYFKASTKPGSQPKAAARHADVSLSYEELVAGVAALLRPLPSCSPATSGGPAVPAAPIQGSSPAHSPALHPQPRSRFYVVLPADASDGFVEVARRHGLTLVSTCLKDPSLQGGSFTQRNGLEGGVPHSRGGPSLNGLNGTGVHNRWWICVSSASSSSASAPPARSSFYYALPRPTQVSRLRVKIKAKDQTEKRRLMQFELTATGKACGGGAPGCELRGGA